MARESRLITWSPFHSFGGELEQIAEHSDRILLSSANKYQRVNVTMFSG